MKASKDPDETLDYGMDWRKWLGGDTIASSTWSATAGITVGTDTFTNTMTTVWLSGGSVRQTYTVTNRITTAAGRIAERSFQVYVENK